MMVSLNVYELVTFLGDKLAELIYFLWLIGLIVPGRLAEELRRLLQLGISK